MDASNADIESMASKNEVVMFSWIHCPFCVRAKEILKPIAKDMKVYECDEMSNGEDLRNQIYKTYQHETVPAIFIRGKFVGGCDDLQKLKSSGELAKMLA